MPKPNEVPVAGSLHWSDLADPTKCQSCHALLDVESKFTIPTEGHPVTARIEKTAGGRIKITEI